DKGIADYPGSNWYARWLPRTSTVITRDGRILTLGPGYKLEGEVLKDGSYWSHVDNTRSFVDGTRLVRDQRTPLKASWWLFGGAHLNAQGQLFRTDPHTGLETEIDLEAETYYLSRGPRVRTGGAIDFANGDVGLPGGTIVKGRIQDALAAGQSALDAYASEQRPPLRARTPQGRVPLPGGPSLKGRIQDALAAGQSALYAYASEQRPPLRERTPQELEAQARRLLDALGSVAHH